MLYWEEVEDSRSTNIIHLSSVRRSVFHFICLSDNDVTAFAEPVKDIRSTNII